MSKTAWHPRGEVMWPDFKAAIPDVTRVEHVQSGRQGTFVRWPRTQRGKNPGYAVIRWDPMLGRMGGRAVVGRVVAYAFDLRPVVE